MIIGENVGVNGGSGGVGGRGGFGKIATDRAGVGVGEEIKSLEESHGRAIDTRVYRGSGEGVLFVYTELFWIVWELL